MAPPSMREEYAELMKRNGDGHYLYTPQRFSQLHPGSVGYFDKYGIWNQITDVSVPGQPEKDGFTPIGRDLQRDKPTERMWKTVSSGSEAESSFGLDAGLSGALSAAPVDVSANAKNKSSTTGKAALITTGIVKNERFSGPVGPYIGGWVKKNAKTLVNGDFGDYIKEYGLWAIHTTWSTSECAITMTSGHSRDTSAGLDVGATGMGKVGASGSSLQKLEAEGWRTYKAEEEDEGLVVSYGGAAFRLHTIKAFRSNPLKQTERAATGIVEYAKPVFDSEGNQIGVELYRPVFDENGKEIGEEKVDQDAEAKKKEQENQLDKASVDSEEDFDIECEPIGLSENDIAADKKAAEEAEQQQRKEFSEKAAFIAQNFDGEEKRARLSKLLEESAVESTETFTYTR
ncbi:hypothetical protein N7462_001304 [Penicillium macrosclerotiorum]|uniref:uncharacterized protein n=1 Tax=Penicillium macrosclerotiorum TaxID=303699 RepID=UPI0025467E75|nr:uncharacterized protein N7462_001304 [Penicillium macrosclerotiorum]KAJ5691881.1 hypothetical protein N7462_001304 [Penicillium macrosclerotiorum]